MSFCCWTKTSAETTTPVSEQQASLVRFRGRLPKHLWRRSILWLTVCEQALSVRSVSRSFRECSNAYMKIFWLRPMACVPQDASSLERAMELCEHLTAQEEYVEGTTVVVKLGSGVHEVEGSWAVVGSGTHQKTVSVPCYHLSVVGQGEGETTVHGCLVVENGRKIRVQGLTVKNSSGYGLLASGAGAEMVLWEVTVEECQYAGVSVDQGAKFDAKECHFRQNGRNGVKVRGSMTTARLTNCTSHHNKCDGVVAYSGAVVDLMGAGTSVYDNEEDGLSAWYGDSTINVYQPCVLDDVSHGNKDKNICMEQGGTVRSQNN